MVYKIFNRKTKELDDECIKESDFCGGPKSCKGRSYNSDQSDCKECFKDANAVINDELDDECISCSEGLEQNECPQSKRVCGHHCNHSWSHDQCCWCNKEFGEEL